MSRRGPALREHILTSAKGVFLQLGFERTSMDEIARRAETSKRSLYAAFANKESLFVAVLDLSQDLFRAQLGRPASNEEEAIVEFCVRYLDVMTYGYVIRMSRLVMAETTRFPQASSAFFDTIHKTPHDLLKRALRDAFGLTAAQSTTVAEHLIAICLYPRWPRVLFGIDAPHEEYGRYRASSLPALRAQLSAQLSALAR